MSVGGGKSSGSQSDPAASTLATIAQQFATETTGLREGLISQFMSILTNPTGKSSFDQAGYNAAMQRYNAATKAGGTTSTTSTQYDPVNKLTAAALANGADPSVLSRLGWLTPKTSTSSSGSTTGTVPKAPTKAEYTTGGGIQVPIIAAALESARQAASQSNQQASEELARTGLAGTPFGVRQLTESQRTGNYNVGQTQNEIMQAMFSMIPNFILGQGQTALSGLSGAVGGNVSGKGKSIAGGK